jgi:hypothetical protein
MKCFTVYFADRLAALFAVVSSPIDALKSKRIGKYSSGVREIKSTPSIRLPTFPFVPFK